MQIINGEIHYWGSKMHLSLALLFSLFTFFGFEERPFLKLVKVQKVILKTVTESIKN